MGLLTVEDAFKRVRKGYKKLNKKAPGWQEKVDTRILNLESSNACVLGQAYGYGTGLKMLGLTDSIYNEDDDNRATAYGFDLVESVKLRNNGKEYDSEDWSLLTETWIFMINRDKRWQSG